jgi:peptide deformylase
MLKNQFKDKGEFVIYTAEQQLRMEKGYLTVSERNQLKQMLDKDYKPSFIKEEKPKLPIVTNIRELKKLCQEVTKEDNIKEIIKTLKDTLACYEGLGLSANQIGIQKRISYLKIPEYNTKERKIDFKEYILINAKIIEKSNPIKTQNEGCLSFPEVAVTTQRYIYCTTEFYNEDMKLQTGCFQDLESFAVQHEVDHQNGLTIFDKKWRSK